MFMTFMFRSLKSTVLRPSLWYPPTPRRPCEQVKDMFVSADYEGSGNNE